MNEQNYPQGYPQQPQQQPVQQPYQPVYQPQPPVYQQPMPQQQMPFAAVNLSPAPSVMDYLWPFLLSFIPFFGSLAFLIVMLVRAFGATENTSLKNHARAMLIMLLIGVVAVIILFAAFGSILSQTYNYY